MVIKLNESTKRSSRSRRLRESAWELQDDGSFYRDARILGVYTDITYDEKEGSYQCSAPEYKGEYVGWEDEGEASSKEEVMKKVRAFIRDCKEEEFESCSSRRVSESKRS